MNTQLGRRWLLGLAIGALLGAAGPTAARPAGAATSTVNEVGKTFSPQQVEIAVNDTVVWRNQSNASHTVTFDNGPDLHEGCNPDALLLLNCQGPGSTVQHTFPAAGTYAYHCKIHGGRGGQGMAGVVIVTAAGSAGTTTSSTASSTTTTTTGRTTTTTTAVTSSTTTTTRELATSSTVIQSTTTTPDTSQPLLPGEPPSLSDGDGTSAAGSSSDGGGDSATVALIISLLLAVAGGGGLLLWRLRPNRS